MSPDDLSTHSVSTHETKDEHREQSGDITVVSMDGKEGSPPTPSVLASFMVDAGHSSVRHTNAQHVTFGGSKVGARAEFHSGDTPGEHPWTPGRDFQPSSILSSPKNFSKVPLFDYQHTPSGSQHDTMRSDTAQAVRSSSGQEEILYQERPREDSTKTPQRKIEGKRTSERDTVREEGSHHFTSPALPGITAKRSDKSSVTLAVSSPTEDAAIEKDSSHDTENTQSSRKKKRRKKKKRAEQALDETQETGDLDSDFLGPKFSNPDHSGFLSLDKNPSRASQIHSIAEETESALRTPSRQYQMDTLSLPKTVYRKSNGPSAEEENREGRKSLSSASAAEEEEDEEKGGGGGHVRKLPKLRTQAKLKSGVPPVPPPTYDSLADSSAIGIKANISGSLGAVTQVYTIDASHSRYVLYTLCTHYTRQIEWT